MTATIQAVCDALWLDLETNVTGLTDASVHLYAAWSYEKLQASANERHISIHILQDEPTPLFNEGHELTQTYEILVWEDASAEGSRRMDDQDANLAWLQLFEEVRARLYVTANESLQGATGVELCWYKGATFAGNASLRVFSAHVEVKTIAAFS